MVASIKDLNLFQSSSEDVTNVRHEQLVTRIYLILLCVSLALIMSYSSVSVHTAHEAHRFPTSGEYERLLSIHADSIDCPCTRISIPYNTFFSMQVADRHPSSTHPTLFSYLFYGAPLSTYSPRVGHPLFPSWMERFYTELSSLFKLSFYVESMSISNFLASNFLTYQALPRTYFLEEMNATALYLQRAMRDLFMQELNLIRTLLQSNALMDIFSSNWKFTAVGAPVSKNASFFALPVEYSSNDTNRTCSCASSSSCSIPLSLAFHQLGLNESIDGLVMGCSILESVLHSTLSCFFSLNCIQDLRHAIDPDDSLGDFGSFDPDLVVSDPSSTRFATNDTVETLASEMFIESWLLNVSYDAFFDACAPAQCTFTYHYRFGVLELFTTFLSVFTGLTQALRFLTPLMVQSFYNARRYVCCPHRRVHS